MKKILLKRKFGFLRLGTLTSFLLLSLANPSLAQNGKVPLPEENTHAYDERFYTAHGCLKENGLLLMGEEWSQLVQRNNLDKPENASQHCSELLEWAEQTIYPYLPKLFQYEFKLAKDEKAFSLDYYHALVLRTLPDPLRKKIHPDLEKDDPLYLLSTGTYADAVLRREEATEHIQSIKKLGIYDAPFFYVHTTQFFPLQDLTRCFQKDVYPVGFDPYTQGQIAHYDALSGPFRVALHDIAHADHADSYKKDIRKLYAKNAELKPLHDTFLNKAQTISLDPIEQVGAFYVFHENLWSLDDSKRFMHILKSAQSLVDVVSCYEKLTLHGMAFTVDCPEAFRQLSLAEFQNSTKRQKFKNVLDQILPPHHRKEKLSFTREFYDEKTAQEKGLYGVVHISLEDGSHYELALTPFSDSKQNAELHTTPLLKYAGIWEEGDTGTSMYPKLQYCILRWADKMRSELLSSPDNSGMKQSTPLSE